MVCKVCNILMRVEGNRLFCPACGMTLIVKSCNTCWNLGNMFGTPFCVRLGMFNVPLLNCPYHDANETIVNANFWHDSLGWLRYINKIFGKIGGKSGRH